MARYDPLPYVRPARERNLRLADLYLRSGEQRAEAERRRGDIQAQLWGNVGQLVGQAGAAIALAPQQERERKAKEVADAQIAESRALQLGEQRRAVNDREKFDLAMGAGSREKTLAALKDRPELYEKAQTHFSNIDTSMKKLLGDAAAGIADFGYTPDAAMAAMDDLLDQGFDEKKIAPFRSAIQQNPEAVKQIVMSLLSQSPDPRHQAMAKPQPLVELNKDTSLYDPNKGAVVASGPVSPPPREPNPTEAAIALQAAGGDPIKALKLLQEKPVAPGVRQPIWVVDANGNFRDLAGVAPPGSKPANTREQGRPVTSGDAKRLSGFASSLADLSGLDAAISANGSTGYKAAAGAALPNFVTEITGWGTSAKQKQAMIDRVRQVIGKALEEGVLRKEDETKYKKILPTISDPNDLVVSKLRDLNTALTRDYELSLEAMEDAGYDTSRFRARLAGAAEETQSPVRVYYDANGNPIQKKP